MRRFGLVFAFALIVGTLFAACGGGAAEEDTSPKLAATEAVAEPTFIRVTVTPVPIDTPVPTIAPTVTPKFTAEQLADPVFPDWLDPELNDEQPDDEKVFAGWQEFLTNTDIAFTRDNGSKFTAHFCSDGIIVEDDGEINEEITWGASRTAAMSSRQWGKVAITVDILAGERAGRTFTYLIISRENGMVMQTGWTAATELQINRSKICLEAFPPEADSTVSTLNADQLIAPVFPDWLDPDQTMEQPVDAEIYAGWTEYLSDAELRGYLADGSSLHLCADGKMVWGESVDEGSVWDVARSAAISEDQWGAINVRRRYVGDPPNRSLPIGQLTRQNGAVFRDDGGEPGELDIVVSQICLELQS